MIAVGSQAEPIEQTISLVDMIAYAGATWDWHRLHYDPEYLAERHLPAPVVDGQLFGGLIVRYLGAWLGQAIHVERLRMRYAAPMFAGERLRWTAHVESSASTEAGTLLGIDCRIDVLGDRPRAAVAPASASVRMP